MARFLVIDRKVLTVIDRVIKSRFFHCAAELGPIKKVMKGSCYSLMDFLFVNKMGWTVCFPEISSTRLMLNVEVTFLEGTLAVNIPPPPSDRLWFVSSNIKLSFYVIFV